MSTAPPTVAEAALAYFQRGWKPIPIHRKTKKPIGKEWQKRPYSAADFEGNTTNVGIQLGEQSGGLTDVDLDQMIAVGLANQFLPETRAIFGHISKPASHQLYISDLHKTETKAVIQYKDATGSIIVELRIGAESKGAASTFPPSMHVTGEMLEWLCDDEPARIDGATLKLAVLHLATASLLLKNYPGQGSRHEAALVLGGTLVRAGWTKADIEHVVRVVAQAAGDDDVKDRIEAAVSAVDRKANGHDIAGLPRLRETWGDAVADVLPKWFGWHHRQLPLTRTLLFTCASEVTPEPVDWAWAGRLARGKITLVAGDPGIGKSQVSLDVGARVSRGERWHDVGTAPLGAVIILSAEDAANDTVVPRLEAAGANLANVHILKSVVLDGAGSTTFSLQQDLKALADKMRAIGNVALVIIDPITSYMGSKIDSHKTTDVRDVLAILAEFVEACHVAALVVSHPPKAPQAKALNAVTGSLAFVAAARLVFLVIEDPENQGRRLLLSVKNNLGPPAPGLGFSLVQRLVFDKIVASHVAWDTMPVTLTANQALAAASPAGTAERSKLREAVSFLLEVLADGPQPASTVREKAEGLGIGWRTIKRASKRLRVTVRKGGFKEGWVWSISDKPPTDDEVSDQIKAHGGPPF